MVIPKQFSDFQFYFFSSAVLITSVSGYTHTQPFYGSFDFVRDNPGEPVPEENSPTQCQVKVIFFKFIFHFQYAICASIANDLS